MKDLVNVSNKRTRNASYDVIRIIALLMIVMVHVSAYVVIFFPDTAMSEWTVGNIFNGLARAGVPMFVLLSGALLLSEDKPFSVKKFYRQRLLPMLLLAVGWIVLYGVFYAVLLPLFEGGEASFSAFVGFLTEFRGSEYPHLWYMLMAVGMYLSVPVLRLFVKRENKKYVLWMIFGTIIIQFAATTLDLLTLNSDMTVTRFLDKLHLEPLTGFLGYLLIGWYLNEYELSPRSKTVLYSLGTLSVIGSTLAVHFFIDEVPNLRDFTYSEKALPALIYGVALFVIVKSAMKNTDAGHTYLASVSDSTFGIYLFHVIPLEIFVRLILPYERAEKIGPFLYILLLYSFVLAVSFLLVRAVGKLRGVRKIFYIR